MADVLQRHRYACCIFYIHSDSDVSRIGFQLNARTRRIAVAEALTVFIFAAERYAARLNFQPGSVHIGTAEFAVHRVRILRRRAAAGEQSRMECKAAVSIEHIVRLARLGKHVFHS